MTEQTHKNLKSLEKELDALNEIPEICRQNEELDGLRKELGMADEAVQELDGAVENLRINLDNTQKTCQTLRTDLGTSQETCRQLREYCMANHTLKSTRLKIEEQLTKAREERDHSIRQIDTLAPHVRQLEERLSSCRCNEPNRSRKRTRLSVSPVNSRDDQQRPWRSLDNTLVQGDDLDAEIMLDPG